MGEQRGGEVDFPALRLHLDDAADDEVADFRGVARAEGADGEEFVGFEEGAGDGGEDLGGGGVRVGSVAAWGGLAGSLKSDKVCQRGKRERMEGSMAYRIHCGSSVTVSPGVTMDLVESFGRFEGGGMSVSPSESREEESEGSL